MMSKESSIGYVILVKKYVDHFSESMLNLKLVLLTYNYDLPMFNNVYD